jgi:molecular chaperone DnaK
MGAPILGIDLGTANSCAAMADANGNVTLVPYRGGDFIIPSIVAVDDKQNQLVGYEAKRQWQLNPKRTVYGAKRMMGVSYGSELVRRMKESVTYPIEQGPDDSVVLPLGAKKLRVVDIAAQVLGKIRDVASEHFGHRVERAVVTVPAYYDDRQRQAVREAGRIAELEVVRMINEPTAAALAYGYKKRGTERLAVFDLGGGTFDMSVIEMRDRTFEVKATGGDIFLGGLDFDNVLMQYILIDFKAKHGVDLKDDAIAMQRLRDVAERVKIDLSSRVEAPLTIPFLAVGANGQPIDLSMIIRRDELEVLVRPLVERTMLTCHKVLDDAGITPDKVDQVLLVGGQTRMPYIQREIQSFFNMQPSKNVHPDEAVAIGAALYAWSLDERSDLKITLLDVIPMGIGIETAKGELHVLFERNSAVPNQRVFTFTTHKDHQRDLMMRIRQGDKPRGADNSLLGEFTFSGLRQGPAGSVRVEVVFELSVDGTLALNARDLDSGAVMRQTVRLSRD